MPSKHTPGPWEPRVDSRSSGAYVDHEDVNVCACDKRDVYMIASALTAVSACKKALYVLNITGHMWTMLPNSDETIGTLLERVIRESERTEHAN